MKLIIRIIFVAVLAAFAASSVSHAAGSAAMAAETMSSSGSAISVDAATDMSDCDLCGEGIEGKNGISCSFVCGSGAFAFLLAPQGQAYVLSPRATLAPVVTEDLHGLGTAPAQQPPRTLI